MDIKLVIFDFDGTIADTRKAIVVAKQKTMEKLGLEVADEETCASTIGLSSKAGFKKTNPELSDRELDVCVSIYREIFEEEKEKMPPALFPDVVDTLEWLKSRGIMCTIASSRNRASLNEFLVKLKLADYFSYVLGGEDTVCLKPHPEPVLKTLQDLSVEAQQTLVIGDMPMDIQMGKGAGVYTCGVTYGNSDKAQLTEAGADYVVDLMAEIKKICD